MRMSCRLRIRYRWLGIRHSMRRSAYHWSYFLLLGGTLCTRGIISSLTWGRMLSHILGVIWLYWRGILFSWWGINWKLTISIGLEKQLISPRFNKRELTTHNSFLNLIWLHFPPLQKLALLQYLRIGKWYLQGRIKKMRKSLYGIFPQERISSRSP